jgi:ATP-binding protein involved in chromosome partitioning
MMKIAVPMVQGRFSEHFGGAESFGLYDVDETAKAILANIEAQAPPHERGAFPRWLHEQGANVILAGGMGPRAVQMFEQYGIQVVPGVTGDAPEAVVKAFLAGTLMATGDLCSGGHLHACGDHDHED